jgi:hypothetical protein
MTVLSVAWVGDPVSFDIVGREDHDGVGTARRRRRDAVGSVQRKPVR